MADHTNDDVYVVAVAEQNDASSADLANSWLDETAARISALAAPGQTAGSSGQRQDHQQRQKQQQQQQQQAAQHSSNGHAATANGLQHRSAAKGAAAGAARSCNGAAEATELQPRHSRQQYLHNVRECLQVRDCVVSSCMCAFAVGWPPEVHPDALRQGALKTPGSSSCFRAASRLVACCKCHHVEIGT